MNNPSTAKVLTFRGNTRTAEPAAELDDWGSKLARFTRWYEGLTPGQQGDIRSAVAKRSAPDPELQARAVGVLEALNARRAQVLPGKTGFRNVDANLRLIRARLAEGATVGDCKAVIIVKGRQVERGEFNPKYYRPATLFNATKFNQYLGELGSGS